VIVPGPRRVRVAQGTLHRELQGEGVLLQLDTGEYYGLDPVGLRIWTLITEVGDLDAVRARLLEEFEVDPQTLSADLERLVGELLAHRLVEPVGEPGPSSP
jgi:hypothetical protein